MEQAKLPLTEKKKISRTYLSPKDTFAVTQLVLAEFAEKKTTDENFAAYAKEKLGLAFCSKHHITGIRNEWKIPAEVHKRREKGDSEESRTRLDLFDQRITSLEAQVRKLFAENERLEKAIGQASPLDRRIGA